MLLPAAYARLFWRCQALHAMLRVGTQSVSLMPVLPDPCLLIAGGGSLCRV